MVKIYSRNIPTTQDLRKIRIFAPRNCSKNNPCDILFMHDAQNLFYDAMSYSKQSWRIIEGMEDSNVSNVIVVGIDNSPTHRLSEYSPYKTSVNKIKEYSGNHGGLGRKYIDWIVKTFCMDKHFTIPPKTITAGSSRHIFQCFQQFGILICLRELVCLVLLHV